MIFEVVIEIKKNSQMKYELNKKTNKLKLDRILLGSNVYPGDYGYLPQTLELDGDPIDVLIWSNYSTFPGCLVDVKIIGGLKMIDDGQIDNKLIAIIVGDPEYDQIQELGEMPINWKEKTWDFFANYKKLEKKITLLQGWLKKEEALTIIREGKKRYQAKKLSPKK